MRLQKLLTDEPMTRTFLCGVLARAPHAEMAALTRARVEVAVGSAAPVRLPSGVVEGLTQV
jgi:hypothetical protein